ncbi:MAG: hypothetical protein R2799_10715 [Crocinitomicaceae bacterium]
MEIKEPFKSQLEQGQIENARKTAIKLAENIIAHDGRYLAEESWGPEGNLYLSESAYALNRAYEIYGDPIYLEAVRVMLDKLKEIQKPSGGWTLEIGIGGNGRGFVIDEELTRITMEQEDLPPTVAALKTIADYTRLSGDDSYVEMGHKAFDWLMKYYDEDYGSFKEDEDNEILKYRSNPRSYHLFSLLGVHAWKTHNPEVCNRIFPRIVEFVKETFESYDPETMPLVYGLHCALLVQFCDEDYIWNTLKPKMDAEVVFNKRFKINERPGGYGHHDGLRGIVTDEAHTRSGAGIIIGMKFFDLYTGTNTYRQTQEYKDLSNWIDSMRANDLYYEYETIPAGEKIGHGSPGQYLPIWWIFGGF